MALQRNHKSDPTFSEERFTILARDGAKVVIRSERGVQYSRNIQDVKKVPECLKNFADVMDQDEVINMDLNNREIPEIEIDETMEDAVYDKEDKPNRPRRTITMPNRFKDMVLYSIFE